MTPSAHPLDNPVWAALNGPHRHLAQIHGQAARYPAEVCGFGAVAEQTPAAWADLATLVGPGATVVLTGADLALPAGWGVDTVIPGVQLVDTSMTVAPDPEAQRLVAADVAEMLDLVARTQPGPFAPRTIEMGTYLGLRDGDALVAMAGERLHPPGWVEISAVCTDAAYRGRGLATRLIRAVVASVRARGETAFLHAAAGNTGAIDLYLALGFTLRQRLTFMVVRSPQGVPAGEAGVGAGHAS